MWDKIQQKVIKVDKKTLCLSIIPKTYPEERQTKRAKVCLFNFFSWSFKDWQSDQKPSFINSNKHQRDFVMKSADACLRRSAETRVSACFLCAQINWKQKLRASVLLATAAKFVLKCHYMCVWPWKEAKMVGKKRLSLMCPRPQRRKLRSVGR